MVAISRSSWCWSPSSSFLGAYAAKAGIWGTKMMRSSILPSTSALLWSWEYWLWGVPSSLTLNRCMLWTMTVRTRARCSRPELKLQNNTLKLHWSSCFETLHGRRALEAGIGSDSQFAFDLFRIHNSVRWACAVLFSERWSGGEEFWQSVCILAVYSPYPCGTTEIF